PDRPDDRARGCMTPFWLGAGTAPEDAGMFSFVVPNGAPVHAAAAGVVSDVVYLEHSGLTHSDLYTVVVRPNADSAFFLEHRRLCPTPYLTEALVADHADALATSDAAWPDHARGALCEVPALVCAVDGPCETPAHFAPVHGDVDAGRRTWQATCAGCHGVDGE